MNIGPQRCATAIMLLLLMVIAWWGLHLALLPPIYKLARPHAFIVGYGLLALACLLLLFIRRAVHKLAWLAQEMHRAISALLVMGALGIDGLMHAFNVPHMEGWWVPILGSGVIASFVAGWLQKWRARI